MYIDNYNMSTSVDNYSRSTYADSPLTFVSLVSLA